MAPRRPRPLAPLRRPPAAATLSRLTRSQVRELLDRHGLSPSRALGQNFLVEPTLVDKIVSLAGVDETSRVVEIGPGLGSLTLGLASTGAEVVAVEIDRYVVPALREVLTGADGGSSVRVIEGDALEVDWDEILGPDSGDWSVVANLPYNVSAPLVLDLLAQEMRFTSFLVMVQREVGERLAARAGDGAYGIPSVLTAYWADARVVWSVPADVFLPRPKVASVLVRIDRRPTVPEAPFADVAVLVRAGFGQRRKMLRRSLAALRTVEQLEAAGIDPTARAENLSLDDWVRLATVGA